MKKKDWSNMSVAELRGIAAGMGVSVKKKMRKADIIDAITESYAGPPTKNPGRIAKPQKTGHVARAVAAPGPAPAQERAHGTSVADMQQAVEESKYYTGQPEPPFPLPSELPHGYGDDQISLMARDPHWAFTYWEVTQKRLAAERSGLGYGGLDASLALRLYDVTEVVFDGINDHGHYDIGVYE